MTVNKQEEIKKLREQGFNLFPLPPSSKTPNIEWKKYQTEKYDSIIPMSSNYAVVCGYNNLVVLDCDNAELFEDFKDFADKTYVVKTGKGYHFYFKHNNSKLPNTIHDLKNNKGQKIDVQSLGAFVVGPGSIHPDTKKEYEVISYKPVLDIDFHLVTKKIEQLGFNFNSSKKPIKEIVQGVNKGNRNDSAFKYACLLLDTKRLDENTASYELNQWNQTNKPPLSESELKTVFESALTRIISNQNKKEKTFEPLSRTQHEKIKQIDQELEKENELNNLSRIEDPTLAQKKIRVAAVIASNAIPYNVPSKLKWECLSEHDYQCSGELEHELEASEKVSYVEIKEYQRNKNSEMLGYDYGSFGPKCALKVTELENTTIKKIRIRPIVSTLTKKGNKLIDEQGNEWKSYDIYIEQKQVQSLEAGKEIEISGIIIPDPKSQKISLFASKVVSRESMKFNTEKIKVLKDFFKPQTLEESISWVTKEFENYSKIVRRENLTLGVLIAFFSPLIFEFDKKEVTGWAKVTIIGDTTTGKSETVKHAIKLLKGGQMISGETASVAGLGATVTQSTSNQWFVEWGPLVLQDRKLLAIDGAHKLNRNTWAELAESEREGKIRITKAAKGEAPARTRQIKIMNPLDVDQRTPRPMNSFFHQCHSLVNNLQIQSIARQDLVDFVINDVSPEVRNIKNNVEPDEKLFFLSDLLNLVWQQDFQIVFEPETIDEILKQATILENKFNHDEIPLITNDEKYKTAKIAASVAALTCSFDEKFSVLTVKKEHALFASKFKGDEYTKAGLDIISRKAKDSEIDNEVVQQIIDKIEDVFEKKKVDVNDIFCKKILFWIAEQSSFTADQIIAEFSLTRDLQRSIIALFKNEDIMSPGNVFRASKNGIQIGKFLKSKQKELFTA